MANPQKEHEGNAVPVAEAAHRAAGTTLPAPPPVTTPGPTPELPPKGELLRDFAQSYAVGTAGFAMLMAGFVAYARQKATTTPGWEREQRDVWVARLTEFSKMEA